MQLKQSVLQMDLGVQLLHNKNKKQKFSPKNDEDRGMKIAQKQDIT